MASIFDKKFCMDLCAPVCDSKPPCVPCDLGTSSVISNDKLNQCPTVDHWQKRNAVNRTNALDSKSRSWNKIPTFEDPLIPADRAVLMEPRTPSDISSISIRPSVETSKQQNVDNSLRQKPDSTRHDSFLSPKVHEFSSPRQQTASARSSSLHSPRYAAPAADCSPRKQTNSPRSNSILSPRLKAAGAGDRPPKNLDNPDALPAHFVASGIVADTATEAAVAVAIRGVRDGDTLPGFEGLPDWSALQQAALLAALQEVPMRADCTDLTAAYWERMERVSRCVEGKSAAQCARAARALAAARPGRAESYYSSAFYR
jgi:hypothetical protein